MLEQLRPASEQVDHLVRVRVRVRVRVGVGVKVRVGVSRTLALSEQVGHQLPLARDALAERVLLLVGEALPLHPVDQPARRYGNVHLVGA